MILRDYQVAAVDALYVALRGGTENPCVVLPTGAGKTPVIARICADVVERGGRVMVLAHVRELLEQAVEKLALLAPDLCVGVYSAGLSRRDTKQAVIVAGIQSVYDKPDLFGVRTLLIVDEAHLIAPGDTGRYVVFIAAMLAANPALRVVGLTATPYRLGDGALCGPDQILHRVCYEAGVGDMIRAGWLSAITAKAGCESATPDLAGVKKRGGEFIDTALEAVYLAPGIVNATVDDIVTRCANRKSVLVFCVTVAHAHAIHEALLRTGAIAGIVTGTTPSPERSIMLDQFRTCQLQYMVNVLVLTLGFDAPGIDCVVMLRPTLSPGLYYQMVGRGFRTSPDKANCLVLDYAGNVQRHGPLDKIIPPGAAGKGGGVAPTRICPECRSIVALSALECGDCGFVFPRKSDEEKHEQRPDTNARLLSVPLPPPEWHPVKDISYLAYAKRGAPENHPKTLQVCYYYGFAGRACEYVCIEHTGYARTKAEKWWALRSREPMPSTAEEAAAAGYDDRIAAAESVLIAPHPTNKDWVQVDAARLAPRPVPMSRLAETSLLLDSDLPF